MIGGSFVERFARTEHEHIEAAPNEIPMSQQCADCHSQSTWNKPPKKVPAEERYPSRRPPASVRART